MSETVQLVVCGGCKQSLDESPNLSLDKRRPCPTCGSTARAFSVQATATLDMRESLNSHQKRPGRRGFVVSQFTGWDLRNSVGDFVRKHRRIDRLANRYIEHVETKDGVELRHVEEPLTKHRDHGSAKKQ